jgi:subtilisin family serine protease
MKAKSTISDKFVEADPTDPVSFSVICRPRSGRNLDDLRKVSTRDELDAFLPDPDVVADVASKLRKLGFEVFDLHDRFEGPVAIPEPIVSARGRVELFQRTFGAQLEKLTRTREDKIVFSGIVLRRDSDRQPSPEAIEGAVRIVVAPPPVYEATAIPTVGTPFCLRVPGDVAQLTRASATHRLCTPAGERATGAGVKVAIVDSGFWKHPYYRDHGYRITRVASPDTTQPGRDDEEHGTKVLANLLACAPDVHAYGIKSGPDHALAVWVAMNVPDVRVISMSINFDPTLFDTTVLEFRINIAVLILGITVVVSAGNDPAITSPARMDTVLAVGGVSVAAGGALSLSSDSASFTVGVRSVPDFCGLSSELLLPTSGPSPNWVPGSGTSFSTPQVAGVAALLLQKNPALTPDQVRNAIKNTASNIASGTFAIVPSNPGTGGGGLVNALKAWQSV